MIAKLTGSPVLVRVAPFAIFLLLTFFQDKLGEGGRYWVYLAKTLAGAGMIWVMRPLVQEMRWKWSWEACVCGVAVFAFWVGLDSLYPKQDELWVRVGLSKAKSASEATAALWNPHAHFGQGAALAWFFVVVRIAGSSLVVPPLEEVFYRSFLYRYLAKPDFLTVPLGMFRWVPFLLTSVLFGFEHNQWLVGIVCGFTYQGLAIFKGRLGDAVAAHALTNLLLGCWVLWKGAWNFW